MILSSNNKYSQLLSSWFMRKTPLNGIRRVIALSASVASDVGLVRKENQDRVAFARGRDITGNTFIVMVLSDGMGGMKEGATSAAITLGSFLGSFFEATQTEGKPEHWLSQAASSANMEVYSKFEGEGGATLAAVLISGNGSVYWLSVGDSRVYHSNEGKLTQISVDDTIAGQLGKKTVPEISQLNLLQYIGIGEPLESNISHLGTSLKGHMLVTSDGVHFLDPAWLEQIISHSTDLGICVRRLTEVTKWCGGPDNSSVAMISLDATLDDLDYFNEPGYGVWDSHGELQLIIDYNHKPTATLPIYITDTSSLPVFKAPAAPVEHTKKQLSEPQSKPKRNNKTSKKTKKRVSKSSGKSEKNITSKKLARPQLHMEFSNKIS